MFKNYLKITLRHLARERVYAAINILGLSLGVACFLIISLYLNMELTYDRFNENHERIYRVAETYANSTRSDSVNTGGALGPTLERQSGDVVASVRFREYAFGDGEFPFRYRDNEFYESELLYADNAIFDVFTFDVIAGDAETALLEPGTIAVSESMAQRYFGNESALNKVLRSNATDYRVTLVFEDLPENTHLHYDALISIATINSINPAEPLNLGGNQYYTYVLMAEGYDPGRFAEVSEQLVDSYGEQLGSADSLSLYLEPLADIHLNSSINQGGRLQGNKFAVLTFTITALFVLVIAGINYINLATARSIRRAKEVGVRKVLGAGKAELVRQFLGESLFYTGVAFIVGICIAELALSNSFLEQILGYNLSLITFGDPIWVLSATLSIGLLGLAAGLYPAFYLARALPVTSLKRTGSAKAGGAATRQVLVLVQFVISITIIASTQLMYSQLSYVNSYSLGFSRDNKILIPLRSAETIDNARQVINELVSNPNITGGSIVSDTSVPGSRVKEGWPAGSLNQAPDDAPLVDRIYVDSNSLSLLDIDLVAGRGLNDATGTDYAEAVVVNQTAVEQLGWDNPVGRRIWVGTRDGERTIVGVVEDFHTMGLQQPVEPLLITLARTDFSGLPEAVREGILRTMIIGVDPDAVPEALDYLESRWQDIDPANAFVYRFLDANIDELYLTEGKQMQLVTIFSLICIFISCLGLLGLAAFTIQQRTKEIGIRKILGATIQNIMLMLFENTFYLMVTASVIASAIAYLVISRWLEGFYYQVAIDPLIFVQSTMMALLIAFITMASQSYKTATANPVEALRYE